MYRIILSLLSFFGGKSSPVRLYPKQSFREKYEAELILGAGAMVIILLFLFAFLVVGPMENIEESKVLEIIEEEF